PAGYTMVTKEFRSPLAWVTGGLAVCPTSTSILGGGGYSNSRSIHTYMNSTFPISSPTIKGWETEMSSLAEDSKLTTYAICANMPPGYVVVSFGGPNPDNQQTSMRVGCPGGEVPLGGGVWSSGKLVGLNVNASIPDSAGWKSWENNNSSLAQFVETRA